MMEDVTFVQHYPMNHVSDGGKVLVSIPELFSNRNVINWGVARVKRTYLRAPFFRLKARRGSKKAAIPLQEAGE